MLKSLRINGLECIVRLFVLVNEEKGNVLDLDPQQKDDGNWNSWQSNNYNNNGYQDSDNASSSYKSKFNRFRVNISPQDLEGIDLLWSLLSVCDSNNINLFYQVQRTLINTYTNLSGKLAEQLHQIQDSFLN